jgi:hypothetical protein
MLRRFPGLGDNHYQVILIFSELLDFAHCRSLILFIDFGFLFLCQRRDPLWISQRNEYGQFADRLKNTWQ